VKATVELPDDLAAQARRCAAESGTTLHCLIEEALRRELARRQRPVEWDPGRNFTFGTGGLTPAAASTPWDELRVMATQRRSSLS